MLRKILGTIISKGFSGFCNLLILLLTAKYLGATGRGEMAIIALGLEIACLFQDIFSGGAITYLIPRFKLKRLMLNATVWNILMAIIFPLILVFTNLFPKEYLYDFMVLALLIGSISLIQNTYLGLEKIWHQNAIEITKALSTLVFLFLFIVLLKDYTIDAVVKGFYFSYGLTFAIALIWLFPSLNKKSEEISPLNKPLLPLYIKIGFQIQLNNIAQKINLRFCYYLIEKVLGLSALGIFSVATSLAESIWVIRKGITTIQYSKSVNLADGSKRILLTQKLAKMSLALTLPATILLLLLPTDLFAWLLGKDFSNFKPIFLSLSPGIIFMSIATVFIHYFSSIEKNFINVKTTFLGNIVVIAVSLLTIHSFGILAGGIATSAGYFVMFFYLFYRFNKEAGLPYSWLRINKKEIKDAFELKEFS